ncbi:MAG: hypothetical protein AAFO95_08065 [Cyanobacteria bacterium J06600_6]
MQQKYGSKLLLITLFLVSVLGFSCTSLSQNTSNVVVEKLGNPSADDGLKGRALNVWELKAFDNKIYLGGGSVAGNVGPINVWAYDPVQDSFIQEYTVREEAIEHFQIIDDALYLPAADPRGNDRHKYYRKQVGGTWQRFSSPAVKLAHVRGLVKLDDGSLLMVGNGRTFKNTKTQPPGAAITRDDGATFEEVKVTGIPPADNLILIDLSWFLTVFPFDERIYALNSLLRDTGGFKGNIAVYNEDTQELELDLTLGSEEFIPPDNIDGQAGKYGLDTIYHLWQTEEFNNSLVYSVKSFSNIDRNNSIRKNYLNSLGLYVKESMGTPPQEINFGQQAVGEDLLVIGQELYALANQKHGDQDFTVYVYKTDTPQDSDSWQKVLSFKSTNRARSFEHLDGTFYFGLGQDFGEAIANSGDILRYTLP